MLAKLTSNQLTLPESVVEALGHPGQVEVEVQANGDVWLRAAEAIEPIEAVYEHIESLGLTEQDITDAIAWARLNPGNLTVMTRFPHHVRRLRHQHRLVHARVPREPRLAG